jgi:hypothetical protein
MTYDNTNRGTLGRNRRKEKDSHPDFSGQCDIEGTGYWISGWVKEANGSKFFSLSFKAKEAQPQREPQRRADPFDDTEDVPF